METTDEHGHLSAATRARTLVAGCHRVEAAELEPGAPACAAPGAVPGAAVPVVALIEGAEELYLVIAAGVRPPRHRVQVTCRSAVPGLGVLRLVGEARPAVPLGDVPGLAHLVGQPCEPVPPGVLVVVPVAVDVVRLLVPATRRRRASAVPVEPDAYRASTPDLWSLLGPRTAAHLGDRHQKELRSLAGHHLDGRAVGAVVVRRITGDRIELGCLDADGVTALTVSYGRQLRDPEALGRWLRRGARGHRVPD